MLLTQFQKLLSFARQAVSAASGDEDVQTLINIGLAYAPAGDAVQLLDQLSDISRSSLYSAIVRELGIEPTLGETLSLMYYNLDSDQRAYLALSESYDPALYGDLDIQQTPPTDAAILLDALPPYTQVLLARS